MSKIEDEFSDASVTIKEENIYDNNLEDISTISIAQPKPSKPVTKKCYKLIVKKVGNQKRYEHNGLKFKDVQARLRKTETGMRRVWTNEETEALLKCYLARKEEFQRKRKKKFAYEKLMEDLKSLNVLISPTTPTGIENKMKSLLRSYKSAIYTERQTGDFPAIFPFQELMEDIFGDKLTSARCHLINLLEETPLTTPILVSPSTRSSSTRSSLSRSTSPSQNKKKISQKEKILKLKLKLAKKKTEIFENKKKLLLFLNEEKNRRHNELIHVLK